MGFGIERDDADVVLWAKHLGRGDGGGSAPSDLFAPHRAGTVDDKHERADGVYLGRLDLAIDGEGLFELGIGPAAGAIAVRAAEHDEAAAEVLGVLD